MKKPKLKLYLWRNYWRWIPFFKWTPLMWKDKWGSPRCELTPQLRFEWLWFCILLERGCDQYWEQRLWIEVWHNGDRETAKAKWPWTSGTDHTSTWDDSLI